MDGCALRSIQCGETNVPLDSLGYLSVPRGITSDVDQRSGDTKRGGGSGGSYWVMRNCTQANIGGTLADEGLEVSFVASCLMKAGWQYGINYMHARCVVYAML